jgi:hypothetical protein
MTTQEVQDRLARAYARLGGLRTRVEGDEHHGGITEKAYVDEFHEALDHLAACGFDVEEFRFKPEHFATYPIGGQAVKRPLFLAKLDAVLKYFELVTAQPKPQLGFHGRTR